MLEGQTDSLLDAGLKDEAEQKGEKNARSGRERERKREKKKENENFHFFFFATQNKEILLHSQKKGYKANVLR